MLHHFLRNKTLYLLLLLIFMPELDLDIIGIPLSLNRIFSILTLFILTLKRTFRIDHRIKYAAFILILYLLWCLLTITLSSQPLGLITSISSLAISYFVILNIYDEFSIEDWIEGFVNIVVVFSIILSVFIFGVDRLYSTVLEVIFK